MSRLAIIGSGIAGMGCAHFLHRHFDLTVFEQNDYIGGHAHTVITEEPGTGRAIPIDTGFMVYNETTYPLLTRLFAQIRVPVKNTSMSFSIRHAESGLEFASTSLNHLFAQRKNLLRPRFWRMLAAIARFNREAVVALDEPETSCLTLGEYVRRRAYGDDFLQLYLLPLSSAVWSTPPELMLSFPAATLLRFFHNHGFLGLHTQHQWLTIDGGAREYRDRLVAPWRDRVLVGEQATRVVRTPRGTLVMTASGQAHTFDHVIVATHADQALRLLVNPTLDELRLLGEFHYQSNTATLHTDRSVMPRTPLAWSSWNYALTRDAQGQLQPATHHWMNRLQNVSDRENYWVTIGPPDTLDPDKIIKRLVYEHPLFSLGAIRAQIELPDLNRNAHGSTHTYFAGSYFRYGFHEDALFSAVQLSELLLGRDPWTNL